MRKLFCSVLIIASLLLISFNSKAQVYTGNLTLNSQTQVDAFNYTSVTGILSIGSLFSGAITNLDGLSELTTVGARLMIDHTSITNVDGLSNLTSVKTFLIISNNPPLTNAGGLSHLSAVHSQNGSIDLCDHELTN